MEEEGEEPLEGNRSFDSLTHYIHKRMPEDEPELVEGEDAHRVARYIHRTFYSPEARAKTV